MGTEKLAIPSEVAELLQIPRLRVERMARAGLIPAIILPDGEIRFDPAELSEWIALQRANRTEGAA